jgi:hypothetical protein
MTETSAPTAAGAYVGAPNRVVSGANGIDYVYRDVGESGGGPRWFCCSTSAGTWTTGIPR